MQCMPHPSCANIASNPCTFTYTNPGTAAANNFALTGFKVNTAGFYQLNVAASGIDTAPTVGSNVFMIGAPASHAIFANPQKKGRVL